MKATKRLITSVWTVEFEKVSDGKVKILNYSRNDSEGYEREKELPNGELIETEGRIVTHLWLKPYQVILGSTKRMSRKSTKWLIRSSYFLMNRRNNHYLKKKTRKQKLKTKKLTFKF